MIGGIDEANKGEILNDIIIVCAYTSEPLSSIPYIGESKAILKTTQNALKDLTSTGIIKYYSTSISIEDLDRHNINDLLIRAHAKVLNELDLDQAYIDCPYTNVTRYTNELLKLLLKPCKLHVQHRYDQTNSLVGIASIIARNIKHENLKLLECKVNYSVGSGCLSDPKTINYIRKFYPNVPNMRKSWDLKSLKLDNLSKRNKKRAP
jgi:ribonuclease HII